MDNDGFCLTTKLFEELQGLGFTNDQMSSSLRRCTNKKLIETSQRVTFEEDINGTLIGDMPHSFRVTSIGAYHLKRWLSVFTYFDAMVFDTPILDKQIREHLTNNINSLAIDCRYERADQFRNYLQNIWKNVSTKPKYFDFEEFVRAGDDTFLSVKRAIEKNSLQ